MKFYIGQIPTRKKWCLYQQEGPRYTPLAYFRNDKAVFLFCGVWPEEGARLHLEGWRK